MAYLTIETTANIFKVDFGTLAPLVGYQKATFHKRNVSFQLMLGALYIRVENAQGESWTISTTPYEQAMIVDTVNGVAPVDNAGLFDLLQNELG